MKRFLCMLLILVLTASCVSTALADEPREIYPLDYDTLPEPAEGQHHYLLCCTDTWSDDHATLGNTDGVILITLDTKAKRIIFTTLTREMLVMRPDGVIGRFTFIAKNYGPEELCRIVGTHFGVKVEKYAIFCMNDIQNLIDAMGGVYITVTDGEADYLNRYRISRTSTTPSMNKAGTYLFSGHAAVIYMRIRKVGGEGDAGRTRRIRTVLSTLTDKYKEATLDDALALLDAVTKNMPQTNLTMADMMEAIGYCLQLRGVTPEGYQMPGDEALEDITYVGMMTRQVDFELAREQMQRILFPDEFID